MVIQIASAVKVTFKCKLLSVPLLGSEKTSCWGFLAKSSLLSLPATHHPPLAPGQPRHALLGYLYRPCLSGLFGNENLG